MAAACVLTATLVACGGRSSLESFAGNALAGNTTGGASAGSFGNSFAGTPAVGGTFGMPTAGSSVGGVAAGGMAVGGTFAGSMPVGGMIVAGAGGASEQGCQLSSTDCATTNEPECSMLVDCEGEVLSHGLIWGTRHAHVNAIAAAVDGRVAVVGYFGGLLTLEGTGTLPTVSDGDDGFALVFDSERKYLWSHFWGGPGAQSLTGVDFAPGGDLVVQGGVDVAPDASAEHLGGHAFVERLGQAGDVVWDYALGGTMFPGQIGVDNDGNITLTGGSAGSFEYRGKSDAAVGQASYLLHIDGSGDYLWHRVDECPKFSLGDLEVDDEDSVIVSANCSNDQGNLSTVLRKLRPDASTQFTVGLSATEHVEAGALAVDRKMRIIAGGVFSGSVTIDGKTYESQDPLQRDIWLGQSRAGDWTWVNTYAGNQDGTTKLRSIATDPAGNVITAVTDAHQVQVAKYRNTGLAVWSASFATTKPTEAKLATDNTGNLWLAASFEKSFHVGGDVIEAQGSDAVILLQLSR